MSTIKKFSLVITRQIAVVLFAVALLSNLYPIKADDLFAGIKLKIAAGQPMPNLPIIRLDNAEFDLQSQLGTNRKSVVIVWATWCAVCNQAIPFLSKLQPQLTKKNINLIGLNVDFEGASPVKKYVVARKPAFPMFLATSEAARKLYQKREAAVPLIVLINENGTVADHTLGWGNDAVNKILKFTETDRPQS